MPTGKRNIAVANIKAVIIQLSSMAFKEKLFSMEGRAILIPETKNVPINDVMETVNNTDICFFDQDIYMVQSFNTGLIRILYNDFTTGSS